MSIENSFSIVCWFIGSIRVGIIIVWVGVDKNFYYLLLSLLLCFFCFAINLKRINSEYDDLRSNDSDYDEDKDKKFQINYELRKKFIISSITTSSDLFVIIIILSIGSLNNISNIGSFLLVFFNSVSLILYMIRLFIDLEKNENNQNNNIEKV